MKSQKWMLDVEKYIGVNDNVRESYEGWLNGEFIYMVFTEKRIIIVEETSLMVQKKRISLDLPYSRIRKVTFERPDVLFTTGLAFTDTVDFKRVFISENESAPEIEKKLRELMKRSIPPLIMA